MIGIGVESSCDETSVAVTSNEEILSLKTFSQIEIHSRYKGVVPEISSRAHLEKINFLAESAIKEAGVSWKDLQFAAVSSCPGLIGSLMIGAQFARCLNLVYKIPVLAVDHLEAHLNAVRLENKKPEFPFIGVLLSGGNSSIFRVDGFRKLSLLGDTTDDSIGEAFDKTATLLGLGYPGGPEIEKKAQDYQGDRKTRLFPTLLQGIPEDKISFSYSGLKTAVLYHCRGKELDSEEISRISYFFQESAFGLVEKNIEKAVRITKIREVILGGGVIANQTLRNRLEIHAKKNNYRLFYPKNKVLCTDNGAMIACLGYHLAGMGIQDTPDFRVSPSRMKMD